jgi:hypothetical protein
MGVRATGTSLRKSLTCGERSLLPNEISNYDKPDCRESKESRRGVSGPTHIAHKEGQRRARLGLTPALQRSRGRPALGATRSEAAYEAVLLRPLNLQGDRRQVTRREKGARKTTRYRGRDIEWIGWTRGSQAGRCRGQGKGDKFVTRRG